MLGVLGFSLSLPLTKVAVEDLDPVFVGLGRALVAAGLGGLYLLAVHAPLPTRRQAARLGLVSLGVVFGFPLFTALALQDLPSAHSAVIVGLLPAATAIAAVARAGERPSLRFWLAAGTGLAAVLAFAAVEGAGAPRGADLYVLAAVALAALGYAEGGALSRELGGPRVISWALVLSVPLLAPIVWIGAAGASFDAGASAWASFAYLSLVSMFLGFFAWYRGLALGGVARIGQVQLLQPLLTLGWSALLLGERFGLLTVAIALLVLLSVIATQRAAVAGVAAPAERRVEVLLPRSQGGLG